MENQPTRGNRPSNPRRRSRDKVKIFKEAYLPFIMAAIAVIVIVGIVIAISTGWKSPDPTINPTAGSTSSSMEAEAQQCLSQAAQLAQAYDYDGALQVLQDFRGDINAFPELKKAVEEYTLIKHNMVSWHASQVPNLSFHILIADLSAALADPTYGQDGNNLYNRNFITCDEFSSILKRLYDNGYVLVDMDDLYAYEQVNGEMTYVEKIISLPEGKKPIMLTETHCNYYSYMVDKDRDGQADSNGSGFASKLCWDRGFYNEMVTPDGTTVTGAFDFVPLLENFIQLYPDFSYKGARAILAFSGYDGIFGYRITSETASEEKLMEDFGKAAVLIRRLREAGYTIACYTYDNMDYSVKSASEIRKDIQLWQELIVPAVGATDLLVFAWEADIGTSYENNKKFDVLYEYGYRFFLGSTPFLSQHVDAQYVRHNRLIVTGTYLYHHSEWYKDLFSTDNLLDPRRDKVPQ